MLLLEVWVLFTRNSRQKANPEVTMLIYGVLAVIICSLMEPDGFTELLIMHCKAEHNAKVEGGKRGTHSRDRALD